MKIDWELILWIGVGFAALVGMVVITATAAALFYAGIKL